MITLAIVFCSKGDFCFNNLLKTSFYGVSCLIHDLMLQILYACV